MLMVICFSCIRIGYYHGRVDERARLDEIERMDDDIYRTMPEFY